MVETCFSQFNLLSISLPKSVTESTDEMIELQLTLFNSNLKGERFKFELERDSNYRKSL